MAHYATNRQVLWNELKAFRSNFAGMWVIAGDFNVTRFACERKGKRAHYRHLEEFNDFIRDMELIDLPLKGRKYTWTNKRENASMAKWDRFLDYMEWENNFPSNFQQGIASQFLDNSPILLDSGKDELITKLFEI